MSKKKQDFIDKELNKASKTLLRKSKKQPAALILVLLIALVLYVKNDTDLFSGQGSGTGGTSAEELQAEGVEEAELTSITDGDTIWVRLNGEKEKIRLLEINTPESVHSDESRNTTFGEEASDYMKSLLEDVDTLYLTRDETDRDQYGRLLRMVWLEKPEDPFDETEIREKSVNARLILEGYALPVEFDDHSYVELFRQFQEEAMEGERGLWAEEAWWTYYNENY